MSAKHTTELARFIGPTGPASDREGMEDVKKHIPQAELVAFNSSYSYEVWRVRISGGDVVYVVRSSSGTYLGPREGYATQAEAEAAIQKAVGPYPIIRAARRVK